MKESYIIANRTDVGRMRQVNEDSMVTFDSPNGRVIAVCDGMGGQAAGDLASRLACEVITDILTSNTFGTPTEAITRACIAANQAIVHRAAQNPELDGMGATCVMVIIKDGLVYYGWVGDSRIYYISNGQIRQLSRDQSYVQQLVDQGQITAAEAENHPQKNQILNALGLPTMTPPELCPAPLTPEPGSIILLCSDGLSGMVDNQTIASIVSNNDIPLQRRADMLVDQANANGGADNITVQMVQFGVRSAAGTAPAASQAAKNSLFRLSIGALIVAIIAFIVIYFCFGKKEETPTPPPPTKVEKPAVKPSPSKSNPSTPTTKKEEPKQPKAGKTPPIGGEKKGKKGKDVDKAKDLKGDKSNTDDFSGFNNLQDQIDTSNKQ